MKTDPNLRNQIQGLVQLHGGACSVVHSSPLHREASLMATEGLVQITSSSTPGYVNIYIKGFRSRFQALRGSQES